MDQLGCKRYCCRRMIMTHVDLIEKLLRWVLVFRLSSWVRRPTHWDYSDTIPLRGTEPKPKYNRSGTRYSHELCLSSRANVWPAFLKLVQRYMHPRHAYATMDFGPIAPRDCKWYRRHKSFLELARQPFFCAVHVYLYCSCCTSPMTNVGLPFPYSCECRMIDCWRQHPTWLHQAIWSRKSKKMY